MLGTLIEGEAMAFLAGVLAHRHFFPFELAVLAATLGAIIADNLVFVLGRFGGQSRLAQKALAHGPVQRLARALERHGVLAILGFRFVYGLKTTGAVLIGTTSRSDGRGLPCWMRRPVWCGRICSWRLDLPRAAQFTGSGVSWSCISIWALRWGSSCWSGWARICSGVGGGSASFAFPFRALQISQRAGAGRAPRAARGQA
ncbi:DedA family protein [Pseudothioclava arenosa]|uniref:DedA family protein n=1 Tax=Pseudothioclava arenosa TaxID=1795308 RepID=UPI0015C989FA|nr:VTT domain-containing protein [Pseudothioclava arenosa]